MSQENNRRESLVQGAKLKKPGTMTKLADVFGLEDARDVKSFIISDVLVPGLKNLFFELAKKSLEMTLFGGGSSKSSSVGNIIKLSSSNKTAYNRSYSYTTNTPSQNARAKSEKLVGGVDNIIFETRGDAEIVLDAMDEIISEYGVVSVSEFYDLAGVSIDNYQLKNFGWDTLVGARVRFINDGYAIQFPTKPHSIR